MVSQWNEWDWEAVASERRGESSREQPQTTLARGSRASAMDEVLEANRDRCLPVDRIVRQ